jgi:tripartite-type tricarboxylate transporter receptor subunit TctC
MARVAPVAVCVARVPLDQMHTGITAFWSSARRWCERLCLAVSFALASTIAVAQGSFPFKPIRVVFPFPPGGGVDIIGRPVCEEVAKVLGQPLVIENRGGSNGVIRADIVARAAPDGYTLLVHTMFSHLTNGSLYPKLPYDTERDFAPISLIGSVSMVLVAHPSFPAKSVAELIALAKEKPGQFSYVSFGSGSGAHLGGELFKLMAGIDLVHVPYKGGGPAIADTIAGHVLLHFAGIATAAPHIKSGKLNALAMTSARRSSFMPNIPTMREAGLRDYEAVVVFGAMAPAGTPRDIVKTLEGAFVKALATPELRQRLIGQGNEGPFGSTAEEMAAFIKSEIPKWARVVKDSGAKVD